MIVSYLSLAALLLVVGLVLSAGIVFLLARWLITPPRMTDGKAVWVLKRLSPGDLGLAFEEVAFDVRDERTGRPLRITGWWMPHADGRGRCAVLVHGYADAKVGAIAWAPAWHALGWNVLAIDLRAHGESGGRHCTGGYFERDDVGQVINLLRVGRPDDTRQLVLFGASFGGAVAVAAAAGRDDVDAVVLDSPVPDFAAAAMLQMERLGAPAGILRRLAIRLAERMTGARFGDVRLLDQLPRLTCPVMVVAPADDALLANGAGNALRAALEARPPAAGPGVYWHVEGAGHLMALPAAPHDYRRRLDAFLQSLPVACGSDVSHAV